jgi:hypothetical protein
MQLAMKSELALEGRGAWVELGRGVAQLISYLTLPRALADLRQGNLACCLCLH